MVAKILRVIADSIYAQPADGARARAGARMKVGARRAPWVRIFVGVAVVIVVLGFLPGRTSVLPLVESDYCYQLIAADRMYEGLGPTSLQPVAPLQPWDWQYDWGFLTQWPIGYPLLVWAVRELTGLPTIAASQWISLVACALAVVGWFVWVKRVVPRGGTGTLLAAVAAGSSVSVAMLINPTTDAILVALVPFVLLATAEGVGRLGSGQHCDRGVIRFQNPTDGLKAGSSTVSPLAGLEKEQVSKTPGLPRGLTPVAPDGAERHALSAVAGLRGTPRDDSSSRPEVVWLVLAGLLAGGLFWIRYASIFVVVGAGAYLLAERLFRRRLGWGHVGGFALGAALPVVGLLIINHTLAAGPTQTQLNLGTTIGFHFTPSLPARAWWNFTEFGFYDHYWLSHRLFASWPVVIVIAAIGIRRVRRTVHSFIARSETCLSACMVVALLLMLIGATIVFGDKFDYVGLARYYQPVKPLYFLLFAAPALLFPRRVVRLAAVMVLIVACSWLVQHEWPRAYRRGLEADREAAPSGQWARCFTPNATALYDWLSGQASPELIVVSNFHEYLAFETGIPTLPIPPDETTLNRWVERISIARHITDPRVLFVLDPDNRWRDYWIAEPVQIVQSFSLRDQSGVPQELNAHIFEYDSKVFQVAASE